MRATKTTRGAPAGLAPEKHPKTLPRQVTTYDPYSTETRTKTRPEIRNYLFREGGAGATPRRGGGGRRPTHPAHEQAWGIPATGSGSKVPRSTV